MTPPSVSVYTTKGEKKHKNMKIDCKELIFYVTIIIIDLFFRGKLIDASESA